MQCVICVLIGYALNSNIDELVNGYLMRALRLIGMF